MGGGTILIPVLTIFFGVGQHAAQAANIISFLPTSLFALARHRQQGLLRTGGLAVIIIPALISAALFSFIMAALPADMLRRLFGVFLIVLAVKQIADLKKYFSDKKKKNRAQNA